MTAEERRLEEARSRTSALEALGPLPQRARLGHGARGLQRRTAPPGSTSRTITPARAPIAGTRTASPASATGTSSICFALALWNGRDPILKERLFGLTGNEGNHGEDVKEYYFYLDSTPTHSYMRYPLQVPAGGVPVRASWSRRTAGAAGTTPEYELIDTGVFDDDRYFDVFVEYAKADAEDMLMQDHRLSTAAPSRRRCTCCRRSGSATPGRGTATRARPCSQAPTVGRRLRRRSQADTSSLRPALALLRGRAGAAVHRERDEHQRGCSASTTARRYVKDGINDYVVAGRSATPSIPTRIGTKAAAHYAARHPAPASAITLRLRSHRHGPRRAATPFDRRSTRSFAQRRQRGRRVLRAR